MRRVMLWVLLLSACGVARASGRHDDWNSVRKLRPGMAVIVQAQGLPEFCAFESADDTMLTCNRVPDPDANWTPASRARLTFPRTGVLDVWRWQEDHRLTAGQWVLAGLFAAWEIGCSVAGGVAGFLFATMIAGVVVLAAESSPYPMVAPPPRPPRMRRKLIYQAPATATP